MKQRKILVNGLTYCENEWLLYLYEQRTVSLFLTLWDTISIKY